MALLPLLHVMTVGKNGAAVDAKSLTLFLDPLVDVQQALHL